MSAYVKDQSNDKIDLWVWMDSMHQKNSLKEANKQEERIDVGGDQVSEFVQDDSVDFKGRPSVKATSGRWRAAYFIMGRY